MSDPAPDQAMKAAEGRHAAIQVLWIDHTEQVWHHYLEATGKAPGWYWQPLRADASERPRGPYRTSVQAWAIGELMISAGWHAQAAEKVWPELIEQRGEDWLFALGRMEFFRYAQACAMLQAQAEREAKPAGGEPGAGATIEHT